MLRAGVLSVGLLSASMLGAGCSDDPVDIYQPLSDACNACLSESSDAGASCRVELQACSDTPACEDYVYCQLRLRCYEEPASSGCEEERGCSLSVDAAPEASERAAAFEQCARTVCAAQCEFVPPN